MTKDSILLNKLDTINTPLSNINFDFNNSLDSITNKLGSIILVSDTNFHAINKKLIEIESQIGSDFALKFAALIVAFMVGCIGLIIFYLTRKKEYKIKKCDIAGEISVYLIDSKVSISKAIKNDIMHRYNKKLYEIQTFEDYFYTLEEEEKPMYNPNTYSQARDYYQKMYNEQTGNLFQARRILHKYFNQYKFYLSKGKRKEFKLLCTTVLEVKLLEYDFKEENDEPTMIARLDKLVKQVDSDLIKKYKPIFDAIETFLENSID